MQRAMRHVLIPLHASALAALLFACSTGVEETEQPEDDASSMGSGSVPSQFQTGAESFVASCSECHGAEALGTDQGPPLVHIYYEPNHHPDEAFMMAAQIGVRQHHWAFGDMPPVENVADEELQPIIDYVRYLQREAGIR